MVAFTILALILGVLVGLNFDFPFIDYIVANRDFVLYLLMFSVGISIGKHRGLINEIKKYNIKIFIIPIGIIVGSILGGYICSFILKYNSKDCMAVASGLGWYSLAGATINDLAGAELGSVAFISNLLRELLAFVLIPFIVKHFNEYTCIAPAGATSEDTSLPMLVKYTNPTIVVFAIFNGIVCSIMVPILISFFYTV